MLVLTTQIWLALSIIFKRLTYAANEIFANMETIISVILTFMH